MSPPAATVKSKRRYDSERRREQARRTRQRIIEVAERRFLHDGYAATTVASVAAGGMCMTVLLQKVGITAPPSRKTPAGSLPPRTARMPRRISWRNRLTPRSVSLRCSRPWIAIDRCDTWAS